MHHQETRNVDDHELLDFSFLQMLIWIIYFWLIAILVVFSAVGRIYLFFTSEAVKGFDLIESFISVTAIIGLYGFAYQTPVLNPMFWKIIWVLLTVTWLWSFFAVKNIELVDKVGLTKASAIVALTSVVGVPTLVGLFFYSFRSSTLWNN